MKRLPQAQSLSLYARGGVSDCAMTTRFDASEAPSDVSNSITTNQPAHFPFFCSIRSPHATFIVFSKAVKKT